MALQSKARRSRLVAAAAAAIAVAVIATVGLSSVQVAAGATSTVVEGGGGCGLNVQCGWPAANMASLREEAASITGECKSSKCSCYGGFGCERCTVQEVGGTTKRQRNDGNGTVDLCTVPWGHGPCSKDTQCGRGLCIGGFCVCYKDWACPYCTMDLSQDILSGATCTQYAAGTGTCSSNDHCNYPHGLCNNGRCECGGGYGCQDCSKLIADLLSGKTQCTCETVNCKNGGTCYNGQCTCPPPFTGVDCSIDPCQDVNCNGHGQCAVTTGKCQCDTGYSGSDCNQGGSFCEKDSDCGIFGESVFGGKCNDAGQCECNDGYTCDDCGGVGTECESATGGGDCKVSADCGNFNGLYGGWCYVAASDKYWQNTGECRCWPGFTCPNCDVKQSDYNAGKKCPTPKSGVSQHVVSMLALLIAAMVAALLVQ